MKCPQCSNQMVLARATNHGPEYEYCRTCKKELAEMTMQKCVEREFGTDIYKREYMQEAPNPDPRIGSRHSSQALGALYGSQRAGLPRPIGPRTTHGILAAMKTLRGLSHLMTPQEDGTTLYLKDRSEQEKCRSVGQVPVHFFPRKTAAPYAANIPCECQTYKRPGVENLPATGPSPSGKSYKVAAYDDPDSEDPAPPKKSRDLNRLDDDGSSLMTTRSPGKGLTMKAAHRAEQEFQSRGIMAEFEYFMPHDSFSLIVHKDHAAEADHILKDVFRQEAMIEKMKALAPQKKGAA